jgi:DnaJ-class molecular chaperone
MNRDKLECPTCDGHGVIVFDAPARGYGDPETVEAEESCERCEGTGEDQRCVDCDERIDMAETCQILRDGKARCASCVEERAAGK